MSTAQRIEANRLNARKSTGPRSTEGKRRSSKNALKHGILVSEPVLQGIERAEDWVVHRSGIFESLSPVGYLEQVLVERVALLLWRLGRIARYETAVAEARIAVAETDVASRHKNDWRAAGEPKDPVEERAAIEDADRAIRTLEIAMKMPADGKVEMRDAIWAHWAIWRAMPEEFKDVSVEGVPDDDMEYNAFDGWTWGLLRRCLAAFAAAARMDPERLRERSILGEYKRRHDHEERELAAKERQRIRGLEIAKELRERMLLEPSVLTRVARYEAALERALFRNLHEIQRLQAARKTGLLLAPAALDVSLNLASPAASMSSQHTENK